MELPIFAQQFVAHLQESGRKTSTITMYKHDLLKFFEWLSKYKTAIDGEIWGDLTREDYERYFTYLKEKKSSEANLKRVASHLNGLIKYYHLSNRIGTLKGTETRQRDLTTEDFITDEEAAALMASIQSDKGLTDTQLTIYPYLRYRNLSMVILMTEYGLTIDEVVSINMKDINFAQNTLTIVTDKNSRLIDLNPEDKKIIYKYVMDIPELNRPRDYSEDPLFISFHAKKLVYWYDYNIGKPKRISLKSIQRMIEKEVERSGLDHNVRPTHFRNSCILKKVKEGWSNDSLISYFGLTSRHALYRIKRYLKN
ncbi:tyrosine-type recombinase/integrase [Priestia aryabhattai]